MATETKTRGRVWEHKETLLLLEKWGDENIQLKLKSCTRKKPIWLEIAAYLRAAVTALDKCWHEAGHIMADSGHQSERSIQSYCKTDTDTKIIHIVYVNLPECRPAVEEDQDFRNKLRWQKDSGIARGFTV